MSWVLVQVDIMCWLRIICHHTCLIHRDPLLFELLNLSHIHVVDTWRWDGLTVRLTFLMMWCCHDFVSHMTLTIIDWQCAMKVFLNGIYFISIRRANLIMLLRCCIIYHISLILTRRMNTRLERLVLLDGSWRLCGSIGHVPTWHLFQVESRQSLSLLRVVCLCSIASIDITFDYYRRRLALSWMSHLYYGCRLYRRLSVLQPHLLMLLNLANLFGTSINTNGSMSSLIWYRACANCLFIFDWNGLGCRYLI